VGETIEVYFYTAYVSCRITFFPMGDADFSLAPGRYAEALLRCASPVAALQGRTFVAARLGRTVVSGVIIGAEAD
ncbi:MAG: hypothetical protein MUD01_27745, partial [Chloroflexaceae bacterium]|jgi:hypothetical protein|nr:hypothetical protein [Chloroflexaceae bacterium]